MTRVYTDKGQKESEVRYFISGLPADAQRLSNAVRGHWSVENNLHWVQDMTFAEDGSRARTNDAQGDLRLLRRWVVDL